MAKTKTGMYMQLDISEQRKALRCHILERVSNKGLYTFWGQCTTDQEWGMLCAFLRRLDICVRQTHWYSFGLNPKSFGLRVKENQNRLTWCGYADVGGVINTCTITQISANVGQIIFARVASLPTVDEPTPFPILGYMKNNMSPSTSTTILPKRFSLCYAVQFGASFVFYWNMLAVP